MAPSMPWPIQLSTLSIIAAFKCANGALRRRAERAVCQWAAALPSRRLQAWVAEPLLTEHARGVRRICRRVGTPQSEGPNMNFPKVDGRRVLPPRHQALVRATKDGGAKATVAPAQGHSA